MPRRRANLWDLMPFVAVVMALSVVSCAGSTAVEQGVESPATSESSTPREKVTHDFVIPAGTAQRIADGVEGEDLGIIPAELKVRVGDRIRVRNDDTELMRLGIFDVRPGETVTMNFNTPGKLEGVIFADQAGGCGVPPGEDESFIIDVKP